MGQPAVTYRFRTLLSAIVMALVANGASTQAPVSEVQPPGRLVDIGGYQVHVWCTGAAQPGRPTVVLSIGGGGFAVDWSLVQRPLSDSNRVCSYDRPGFGWSSPGPYARTFKQEAFELRRALEVHGERPPYVLAGQSLGAFVVRQFTHDYEKEVAGVLLVDPTNENGKLGYRGQFILLRTVATDRPIPPVRTFAESPPTPIPAADCDSARARASRTARIVRPFDQLGAQAQRHRVWALAHPACAVFQDDYFAEQMAAFYKRWATNPHPLGDVPLIVVLGTISRPPPPGLSEADLKSDSMRIDLSRLSRRGRLVRDSLSGHHVQLDNPILVVNLIRELLQQSRVRLY